LADSSGEERKGRWPGAAEITAALGRARQKRGEEERKVKGPPLTSGAGMSARQKEKKKETAAVGEALAGSWAARLKGKRGRFVFFFFFFKLFSKQLFKIQIQIKFLLNFSQNFIIFLKVTQATKNHAKSNNDAQPLVVSRLIKLSVTF
jgi:hypothetical protein